MQIFAVVAIWVEQCGQLVILISMGLGVATVERVAATFGNEIGVTEEWQKRQRIASIRMLSAQAGHARSCLLFAIGISS